MQAAAGALQTVWERVTATGPAFAPATSVQECTYTPLTSFHILTGQPPRGAAPTPTGGPTAPLG